MPPLALLESQMMVLVKGRGQGAAPPPPSWPRPRSWRQSGNKKEKESQLEVGAFGSRVKPRSQVKSEEPVTGWVCVPEPSRSMPHGAVPGAELPARIAAPTGHCRNPSIAGCSILPGENWAFQLKVKVFESKPMLFANQRVKKILCQKPASQRIFSGSKRNQIPVQALAG